MKKQYVMISLASLLLASCSQGPQIKPSLKDYQTDINIFKTNDTVRILQLTDIHWSFATDYRREQKYFESLAQKADPDIIMTTGDNVLSATSDTIDHLFSMLNSLKNARGKRIYWGVTWGNHDRQGIYDPDYPDRIAKTYSMQKEYDHSLVYENYGLYKNPDDDIQGRSNYVVNLTDGSRTIWQLYAIDSNSDHFNGTNYTYDVIRKEQIEWFENQAKESQREGNIPSLAFFHIPLFQLAYSYDNAKKGIIKPGNFGGELRERTEEKAPFFDQIENIDATRTFPGYEDTGFFHSAKQYNVKGMFFGHDHVNDFWALYDDKATAENNPNGTADDILLAYGVKTGDGLYFSKDLIGGNLITIHKDGSFDGRRSDDFTTDFSPVFLKYEEVDHE